MGYDFAIVGGYIPLLVVEKSVTVIGSTETDILHPMSRVFLSYSRKDEDFATRLRTRLEAEAPDILLWQDRTRLEGGVGWWQQVKDAIDRVEFMVLVMGEDTAHSETVRKEWRYARQQGVCVYPVQAAPFEFAELPRWMSSVHFFDLEKEWPTFVQYLRSPAYPRRVAFMAPDLPVNFVSRPVEFRSARDNLLEHKQGNAVAITTALHGAGGFGKTTLAAALCHDDDVITAYFDGILWVTLGRTPNLQAAVTLLHNSLAGEQTAFPDVESAGLALAAQIQDRTCLMVIDDVWDLSHLRPFLRAGANCARLITTRDFRIAADFVQVRVDEMRGTEATQLLCRGIAAADTTPFEETARRLGEWPLLLELANATLRHRVARGDSVDGALAYLNRALERRGVTRFDPLNESKIARTIEISLESLPQGRQHYFELAVFPENTDIPMGVVQDLWELDDFDAEELLQSMQDLSLLRFDLQAGNFRLHDAIRTWIREQLPNSVALHAKLLSRWGDLHTLPHAYAWRWAGYHLAQSRQSHILRDLLLDFGWLQAKLAATDVNALIIDCDYLEDDAEVNRIQAAIRLSAHILSRDKAQFAGQLLGRLPPGEGPSLTVLLQSVAKWRGTSWLRPVKPSLTQAGGPLMRTIPVASPGEAPLVLSPDGSKAFCISTGAIEEWDLESGVRVRTLNNVPGAVNAASVVGPGLAVFATDKTLRLWDLDTDTELHAFHGHTGTVTSLAVTPGGNHVVSASADGTIRQWNLESGDESCCISAHAEKVSAVCLLSQGRALSGSRDGKLRLWDLTSGEKLKSFLALCRVTSVAVTPDDSLAVAGLSDGTLKVWNVETGDEVFTMSGHTDRIGSVAVATDGQRAISASWDGTLRIWNLVNGSEICCLTGHTDRVNSVVLSADGSVAVSLSHDETMKLWDLHRAQSPALRSGHTDVIVAITANPSRGQVLSASRDGTIRVWDMESHSEVRCLRGSGRELSSIAATPDGARAICGFRDHGVELCDLDSGQVVRSFVGHKGEVAAIAVTSDGQRVLSASEDRTVRMWDIDSGAEIRHFVPHTRSVTAMALGEGQVFSGAWDSGSWDGALKLWNLESGEATCSFRGLADSVSSVAVTGDFRRGVCGCWDGTAKVWDLRNPSELLSYTGHEDTITAIVLTPDGALAASTSQDRTLHVWETATGRVLAKFTGDGPLTACAIVGKEPTFIVGEASGAIHFLRLEARASEGAETVSA